MHRLVLTVGFYSVGIVRSGGLVASCIAAANLFIRRWFVSAARNRLQVSGSVKVAFIAVATVIVTDVLIWTHCSP